MWRWSWRSPACGARGAGQRDSGAAPPSAAPLSSPGVSVVNGPDTQRYVGADRTGAVG
jgi:hypothetical protein